MTTTDPIRPDLTDGARVSVLFRGERLTGRVTSTSRRGGHSRARLENGKLFRVETIELGTLDSVSIATDQDVLSPTGRVYRAVIVRENFDDIRLLDDEPETDVCATCLESVPVEELGVDGNGDVQCGDCRSVDWSVEDAAAFRAYAIGR